MLIYNNYFLKKNSKKYHKNYLNLLKNIKNLFYHKIVI